MTSNNNISLVLTNKILIIFYSPIVFLQLSKAKKEIGIIYLSQWFGSWKKIIGE